MVDENGSTLGQSSDTVGLYLGVRREDALGQAGNNRFGKCEVLSYKLRSVR